MFHNGRHFKHISPPKKIIFGLTGRFACCRWIYQSLSLNLSAVNNSSQPRGFQRPTGRRDALRSPRDRHRGFNALSGGEEEEEEVCEKQKERRTFSALITPRWRLQVKDLTLCVWILFFFFFFLPVGEERGGISPDKGKEGDMKRAANKTGGGGGGGGGAAGGGGGGVALWQSTLKASSSLFSDLPGPPEQAVCVCSCVCGGRVVRFSWKQSGSDHKNQLWDLFDSSDQTRFFFLPLSFCYANRGDTFKIFFFDRKWEYLKKQRE